MPPTPHTATTSTRAKASFKKNGPRLPEYEMRRIERGSILDRRAEELKEREARRKKTKEKARLKDAREREGRAKMGLGLATQLVGFSHTQRGMKGAMEGFLGIKKTKDGELRKGNNCVEEKKEVAAPTSMEDTIDEDLFDDDICLAELVHKTDSGGVPLNNLADQDLEFDTDTLTKDADTTAPILPSITYQSADPPTNSPTRPKIDITESQLVSPPDMWGDLFASGTQICRELSQPKTPSESFVNSEQTRPNRNEDLDPKSDDLFDSAKKTCNPQISFSEGVIAHDFAYFRTTASQNIVLGDRVIPKSPSSFGSLKRKRGHKFPNAIAAPSPKTTSNCPSFTAAQMSFTADLTKYGISTQVVAEFFGDESDTDEEDFSFQAQPAASKRPIEMSQDKDRVLMPPPPLRMSPKIFKPPSQEVTLPKVKEGLGIGIYGVSTQDMRAVFLDDDGSDTEEDEFGPSLPSPPSKLETKFDDIQHPPIKRKNSPTRLQESPFIKPAAKKARLVFTPQAQPQPQHFRGPSASGSGIQPRTAALTRSFSGPTFRTPPAPMNDLHRFGISTQVLNDFVEDDVELSPVDEKGGRECRKLNNENSNKVLTAGTSVGQPIDLEANTTSRSFEMKDDVVAHTLGSSPQLGDVRKMCTRDDERSSEELMDEAEYLDYVDDDFGNYGCL